MTVIELKEKRTKLMADASKLIRQPDLTTEHRNQFDRMLADVDLLEADLGRLERTAQFEAEQRSTGRPPRPQPGQEVADRDETAEMQKRAFTSFIRFGEGRLTAEERSCLRPAEVRDIGTTTGGSITGGGQLIPQAFYPTLVEAQKAWGAITTLVNTKKTDNGAPMKIAFVNDTGNEVTVLGEATTVTEVDPTFNGVISSTDKVTTGIIKVTLEELQDSAFDLDSWIRDAFGKRYWRGVSSMITNGSSTGNVQALNNSSLQTVTSINTTSISYYDLVEVYSSLDPAYVANATWVVNSATRGILMQVTDNYGHPLLTSPINGGLDYILGRPVVINQFQPNVAHLAKGSVLFGDLRQAYTFRSVGDLQIIRLNERYIDTGEIGFIGFARIGGFSTDAGTHPLITLAQS
jgi:HK97 family phage major capsid protein